MLFGIAKCPKCGKLYATQKNKRMCSQCYAVRLEHMDLIEEAMDRWNLTTPEEIAEFAGLSVGEVQQVVRETHSLRNRVEIRHSCKKCGRDTVQAESEYCLTCRLMLNQAFGLAADDLAQRAAMLTNSVRSISSRAHGVVSTMEDKRAKSHVQGRFTPKNRWSD